MFTIGEFARLTGVSAKRLRHYDAIGLFRPVWVDPDTRYRHYSATQIPELRRIGALSGLGIPLRRIRALRDSGRSLAHELERRRAELDAERRAAERKLVELDIRLEHEGDVDVIVRRRPRGRWASLRDRIPAGADMAPLFVEVESHVLDHAARASSPPAAVLHAVRDGDRDVEILIPIDRPVSGTDRISAVSTPQATVASSLVVGGYERIPEVVAGLGSWADRVGLAVSGPAWHLYLRFGAEEELRLPDKYLTSDRRELVTEVMVEVDSRS